MARQEFSLYEKNHINRQEQSFGITLGKIVDVDAKNRLCSVATFMGSGSMNDQYIDKCQWLSADVNPEGDESGSIPRRGSIGLVFFVDGETFIWGFLRALDKGAIPAKGNNPQNLVEGDKVVSTIAGNRLTIKRSGLIELFSKDSLQRLMFPLGSKIVDLCRAYTLRTDGGTVDWGADKKTQLTKWRQEFRRDLLRTLCVIDERGYVSSTVASRTTIGTPIPGSQTIALPVYMKEISVLGEVTTAVTPPLPSGTPAGFKSVVGPDGSVNILAGAAQTVKATVAPEGAVVLDVNSLTTISISPIGDVTIKSPGGTISVTPTSTEIKANGPTVTVSNAVGATMKLNATQVGIGSSAGEVVDLLGQVCEKLSSVVTSLSTTMGNMGYSLSSAGDFVALIPEIAKISANIQVIKGGI